MKKQLNESQVANELRDGSLFFTPRKSMAAPASKIQSRIVTTAPNRQDTLSPSHQEVLAPRGQGDNPSAHLVTKAPSPQSSPHTSASTEPALLLSEREYFRCSLGEVEAIEDLKTKLRRNLGIHTSKQDIERFAVHRAVEEYEELGERSQLVSTLRKLNKR